MAIFGLNLPITARVAITGYGARRERAADAASLDALARAGMDPREAAAMYEALTAHLLKAAHSTEFASPRPIRTIRPCHSSLFSIRISPTATARSSMVHSWRSAPESGLA